MYISVSSSFIILSIYVYMYVSILSIYYKYITDVIYNYLPICKYVKCNVGIRDKKINLASVGIQSNII